jgi:hypothetical protein
VPDFNVRESRDLKAGVGKFSLVPNCPYVLPYSGTTDGLPAYTRLASKVTWALNVWPLELLQHDDWLTSIEHIFHSIVSVDSDMEPYKSYVLADRSKAARFTATLLTSFPSGC